MTWHTIRIPKQLRNRIDRLRKRLNTAYLSGNINLKIEPNGDDSRWDGHIPVWKIVERAMDEYEDHLERSNKR